VQDLLNHFEKLATMGASAHMLRDSHRTCRWLIGFDDFCQAVLVRAMEHLDRFRGETQAELLGWLRAVGRHLAAQLRRAANGRLGPAPLHDIADRARISATEEAENTAEQATNAHWLAGELAALDLEDSELLQRHYWGRESFAAIALDLGLSPNTLTQRHGRLLQRLRATAQQAR
jgi:RNA polymerase sigma factor (sigma-70 family)